MPDPSFGTIYLGAPIELASERMVLASLAKRLEQNQTPYIVIANAQIGGRQIDCLVVSGSFVMVIEVKASRTPLRGDLNGAWARRDAGGSWRPYGNAYQQAVGAKNALRDTMSAMSPIGGYYPDACVVFAGALPAGSDVTAGDFKARVMTLTDFLADFAAGTAKKPPWGLDQWHAFAAFLSLAAVSLEEAVGGDQVRRDLERLRLYNAAVTEEYGRAGDRWLREEGVPEALERAAADGGGCVIVGPSGCGKTLMAKALASRLAGAGSPVLFFSAKDFAGEWAKAVRREIGLLTDDFPAELLRAVANGEHPAFLIVDGVNELAGSEALALRGLRALARRLDAKVVLTSQGPVVGFDGLSPFEVSRPSVGLKKRIAERDGRRISGSVADLLRAVASGLEAEMVGDVGSSLASEATRLALIDQYVRARLGSHARAGAFGLRCFAVALHKEVAFSMAEARFDELMRHETVGFDVCDGMFAAGLLVRRVGRVSFSHEMILNGCAAFGLANAAAHDPETFGERLATPLLAPLASEIVTAIEDSDTSMRVLESATRADLIAAAAAGSLGSVAASNACKLIQTAKQACIDEIAAVSLEFDPENKVYATRWSEGGRRDWTPPEKARLGAIGKLATSLAGFQDYQDLCAVMDARLLEERRRLAPALKAAGIGIRSPSFALSYYSMGDRIGFNHIDHHGSRRLGDTTEALPTLDVATLTSGQLHFYLENRHAFFGADERGKFAEELIFVLRERFSREPYHVQLAALSAVGFAREAPDEVLAELVDAINGLEVPQHNWAINSSIIDALGFLGALDDDAENAREGIRAEIADALRDGADGNGALSLYVRMFDHPFSTVYYEEIHELSEDERRMLYRRALASVEIKRSMSLRWITDEVARLDDPADAPLFVRFVALPDRTNPLPQEEWGAFTLSLRFLGRHGASLPAASEGQTAEEACLNDIRILVHAAESQRPGDLAAAHDAWARLLAQPPGLVVGCFSEINAALMERHWADDNRPYPPIDLRDTYPTETLRLARRFVDEAADPQYFHAVPLRERGPEWAFGTLGRFGDRNDVEVLRRLGRAHRYSTYALDALKVLDSAAAAQ